MVIHTGFIRFTGNMKRIILLFGVVLSLAACSQGGKWETSKCGAGDIYPDYKDVTIPCNIAPLNFDYCAPVGDAVTTFTCGDLTCSFKGNHIRWKPAEWREFLAVAKGGEIEVCSEVDGKVWTIHVSDDEIDNGMTYRLLEPGYELYSRMGIYERDLSSFKQRTLIENTDFGGCVNCHSTNRGDPDVFSLHIRGDHGATLIRTGDGVDAYNTKTENTLGFCVYPYWHPSGNYIAYSTNSTRQIFHTKTDKRIEVFDLDSDLQVYDILNNQIVTAPQVKAVDSWETFPSFSPDGRTLYFCSATHKTIPDSLDHVRYNLYCVSFDPENGKIGGDVRLLVDAESEGKSISFPKPSYDGKYILYTMSDYGQFSIWHHEADLWMLDLRTGEKRPLDEVNSDDTESYHNWSSNSRWFVFSSRRDDGLFTRPYFAHVSEDGTVSKPFMLPQKDPAHFYETLFMSYNVPEFVTGRVDFNHRLFGRMICDDKRTDFGFRWSD